MPKSHSVWALFYNKTLFDKAKLPYPTTDWRDPSWTWDKYLDLAKALTVTEGGKVKQYGAGSDFGTGWTSGWSHGGWWFNHDWVDTGWITKFTAPDEPATIDAVQFWADLQNKFHYSPTAAETQGVQAGAPNLFMTGLIGMYLEYTGQLNQYAKITDFEWGIAPWPHVAKDQYPTHHGAWIDQWSIFKAAKNVEGSWEFLKFVASPDGEKITDIQRGSPSSRKAMGQAWVDQWKSQLPKVDAKQLQVITDAMAFDWLTPDNWSVNFSPVDEKVLEPALDKVFLGQQSAADAIKGVKPKIDQAIADTLKSMGYSG
jgi:multiple sugar transport system substrate-binding protein